MAHKPIQTFLKFINLTFSIITILRPTLIVKSMFKIKYILDIILSILSSLIINLIYFLKLITFKNYL